MNKEKKYPILLIVDDNAPLLSSWKRALQRDFEVLTATNAEDAVQQFRKRIDIALVDIRLDDEDEHNKEGVELLQQFRAQEPDLPVVMVSGFGDVDIAVECMRLGASDFVEKKAGLGEIKERLFRA
ncbi:MAG: response regulator, partial [Methanobacteriota archaeon]